MQNIQFPVDFLFKISTFSSDFTATDAHGEVIAYVKQKMFKLKEDIRIYTNDSQTELLYRIKADRWLDFSAAYSFYDRNETQFGKIARKGWRSIWRASYDIIDEYDQLQYKISEKNPWVKVGDALLGEIPIVNFLTGYVFNPTYVLTNKNNEPVVLLTKQKSFWGRKFQLTQVAELDENDDDRILLGLMMMILLERRRG